MRSPAFLPCGAVRSATSSCALLLGALLVAGCHGRIVGGKGGADAGEWTTPIRLLTNQEFTNTIQDLFGTTNVYGTNLPSDATATGYTTSAYLQVSEVYAETLMQDVEQIATDAMANLTFSNCLALDATCATDFVRTFGQRAWRRPLTDTEVSALITQVYTPQGTFQDGIRLTIEALLLSPNFMYRVETGTADPTLPPWQLKLSSWEMASRLSYQLWHTMPDAELFAQAQANALQTPEQVLTQANRMLADPRAEATVADFADQWLGMDVGPLLKLNYQTTTPTFAQVQPMLKQELDQYVTEVVFRGSGTYQELLTANYSFWNATLAAFYGEPATPAPTDPTAMVKVTLDPSKRGGLLTRGMVTSVYAHNDETSPTLRGKLIRIKLLCETLAPPPMNVQITLPPPDPTLTTRERFTEHMNVAGCSSCHTLMDPIGFGFENYDEAGRFRTTENGQTVDSSGTIVASDVPGSFAGLEALESRLVSSQEAQDCMVKQLFRYAYGRNEGPADATVLGSLEKGFASSGGNIRQLLAQLTQSPAFLYRSTVNP